MKKVACVIALAGTTLSLGTALTSASASPESVTSNGLRLSIPNAKIFTNEFTTTVDMQFRGGDIRALELFVDGALLKKQELNTQSGRGVVSFALDGLADGVHTVLVRSQDLAGNWVTTSAKFKVAPAPESTLARALYPMRGQMVQGVVPIKVELSDTIRNPYVSFSIDDEFMAIMNGGPFAYAWDSAKASNGLHTITADIFDDVAKIKTLKIQINVNNAGGFTNIQREPVAPSTPANTNNLVSETIAKFSSPTSVTNL
ncbi:MAG: Ig-like domain-containing protein [Armatimonadetes bacterium]|nr:Ig-like domain-containing protein [Armatimonadota bacterium]